MNTSYQELGNRQLQREIIGLCYDVLSNPLSGDPNAGERLATALEVAKGRGLLVVEGLAERTRGSDQLFVNLLLF